MVSFRRQVSGFSNQQAPNRIPVSARRSAGQRGSALLIVFVFAAIALIMLYREIPIATFEAKRQREQLLVDRGHEYQRAVQLYYRKFRGQYPASVDQLISTNNMRFLRRRYVDPMTGKDDWRLLHAGPGGILIDSKVHPLDPTKKPGEQSSSQADASSTGNAAIGASDSSMPVIGPDGQPIAAEKHSPPAISSGAAPGGAANGNASTPTSAELDQDPSRPLLPSANANANANANADAAVANAGPDAAAKAALQAASAGAGGAAGMGAGGGTPVQPGAPGVALANGAPLITTTRSGLMGSGGLAGVASTAQGHTIKRVNDQQDYSLWEFWYDPTKDTGLNGGGTGVQNGLTGAIPIGGVQGQQGQQPQQATGQGDSSTPDASQNAPQTQPTGGRYSGIQPPATGAPTNP